MIEWPLCVRHNELLIKIITGGPVDTVIAHMVTQWHRALPRYSICELSGTRRGWKAFCKENFSFSFFVPILFLRFSLYEGIHCLLNTGPRSFIKTLQSLKILTLNVRTQPSWCLGDFISRHRSIRCENTFKHRISHFQCQKKVLNHEKLATDVTDF